MLVLTCFIFSDCLAQKAKTKSKKIKIDLPAPYATPDTKKNSKVIGWPEGKTPVAPEGLS
jgi:hypothetical protein